MGLAEGEVGKGEGSIQYDGISSCLTITCLLDDDAHTHVGGHASLMRKDGAFRSIEILGNMSEYIPGDRKVLKIHLQGALGSWHPDYLTSKPYFTDGGEKNYDDIQIGDCSSVVADYFKVDSGQVTSKDEEGSFAVQLVPDVAKENKTIKHSELVSGAWKSGDGDIDGDTELAAADAVQDSSHKWFMIDSIDMSADDWVYTISG